MSDVTLSYKGDDILELSDSGSATLKTGGKYCEDDIAVEYVKPSGGVNIANYLSHMNNQNLFNGVTLPETVEIHFLYLTNLNSAFRTATGVKNLILSSKNGIGNFTTFSYATASIEMIDFTNLKIASSVNYNGAFWNMTNLKTFVGLNLSGATNVINIFAGTGKLENLSVVPNSCSISISYNSCSKLTDNSVISIANSLISGNYTLTLHATPKAKLSTIMGTVSQVTDDTGTYDFFTADENGTVTLLDFITNTKGWTVA